MPSVLSSGWSVENFLSLVGVGFGLICSAYLVYDWFYHRRTQTHILLWAIGLALFYVFLIPFIPVKFGQSIFLDKWADFFSSAIPLVFLGWVFIYWGIVRMRLFARGEASAKLPLPIVLWVIASLIFYAIRFSPTPYGKALSIIGIVIFFLAIHTLILIALWKWFGAEWAGGDRRTKVGIITLFLAVVLSIVRYLVIAADLTRLPQDFWFLAIADFDIGFILRSAVIVLLAVGFMLVHRRLPPQGLIK